MNSPFPQTKIGRIGIAVFLAALLLLSRDSLFDTSYLGFARSQAVMIALTFLVGAAFLIRNLKNWKAVFCNRRVAFLGICAAVMLLPMLVNRDWQMMYFSILFCLGVAVLLSYFLDLQQVARCYAALMGFLGAFSILATYLLINCIVPYKITNSVGLRFYNYLIAFAPVKNITLRNYGIFREPGVYQFFLLLALYLNHYHASWEKAKVKWGLNVLLCVTMLTTMSVGGIAEMGLLVLVVFFEEKWYRRREGKAVLILGVAAAALVLLVSYLRQSNLYWQIVSMVVKITSGNASSSSRMTSVTENLKLFVTHPIFGVGIRETLYAVEHNTSSTTILLAIFGVLGGCLNIAAWVSLIALRKGSLAGTILCGAALFLSFNTTNLITNPVFWLFPMLALTDRVMNLPIQRK